MRRGHSWQTPKSLFVFDVNRSPDGNQVSENLTRSPFVLTYSRYDTNCICCSTYRLIQRDVLQEQKAARAPLATTAVSAPGMCDCASPGISAYSNHAFVNRSSGSSKELERGFERQSQLSIEAWAAAQPAQCQPCFHVCGNRPEEYLRPSWGSWRRTSSVGSGQHSEQRSSKHHSSCRYEAIMVLPVGGGVIPVHACCWLKRLCINHIS